MRFKLFFLVVTSFLTYSFSTQAADAYALSDKIFDRLQASEENKADISEATKIHVVALSAVVERIFIIAVEQALKRKYYCPENLPLTPSQFLHGLAQSESFKAGDLDTQAEEQKLQRKYLHFVLPISFSIYRKIHKERPSLLSEQDCLQIYNDSIEIILKLITADLDSLIKKAYLNKMAKKDGNS